MATKKITKTAAAAASGIKMPVSFKEFSKEPVKGLMFLCIIAVGYLYVDIKMSNSADKKSQNEKIYKMEIKLDELTNQLRRSDSLLSSSVSKINTLQELGKIK